MSTVTAVGNKNVSFQILVVLLFMVCVLVWFVHGLELLMLLLFFSCFGFREVLLLLGGFILW